MSRVLFVDDDYHIRALYAEELAEEGYDIITCGDATRLMDLIARNKPDLLVMEVHLEKEDRWDLVQAIRESHPALPLVLNTASLNLPLKGDALVDAHVIKSIDMNELKAKIRELLEGAPAFRWEFAKPRLPPASRQPDPAQPPLLLPYYSASE